jgi:hypothetical protein
MASLRGVKRVDNQLVISGGQPTECSDNSIERTAA